MSAPAWISDHDEVLALARWLDNRGAFNETGDVLYFFEKPWKWTNERSAMKGVDGWLVCKDCDDIFHNESDDDERKLCDGCLETRHDHEAEMRVGGYRR